MLTLRRNAERDHVRQGARESWRTFLASTSRLAPTAGFGVIVAIDEIRIPPNGISAPCPGEDPGTEDAEAVTYVCAGAIAYEDSAGDSGVLHAGEFQHVVVGRGTRHRETNASRSEWAHVLRITLLPSVAGLEGPREQRRFAAAQRHNILCVVASFDGRRGSLRLGQDALVCSSVLDPGHHLIHELPPGRSAWLQLIGGEVALQNDILGGGDGAWVTAEPSVSFTARLSTEVLLVDSGPGPGSRAGGIAS
jgi:redox-sensitive bicupin YhaK (pirin superfamily)